MFRILRSVPSLQRKFMYIVFACGLVFLIYLLSSNSNSSSSSNSNNARDVQPGKEGGLAAQQLAIQQHLKNEPQTHPQLPAERLLVRPPQQQEEHMDQAVDKQIVKKTHEEDSQQLKSERGVIENAGDPLTGEESRDSHEGEVDYLDKPVVNNNPQAQSDGKVASINNPQDLNDAHHDDKNLSARGGAPSEGGKYIYKGPQNAQQEAVVGAFLHAWEAYRKYAWGHDELKPLSKGWQEWMGVALTMVDSLDTMYIMGLNQEFKASRDWIAENLKFDGRDTEVQLFEIVIRELGGLLSAYHLSGDEIFKQKALELGEGLFPCLKGPTKIPCNRINLKRARPSFIEISTAETGTIQLEFKALARATGERKFEEAMEDISQHLHNMEKLDGLVPCFINAHTGTFRVSSTVSMGASADSYYEYLLKQWIQTGKTQDWLRDDYLAAVEGMKKHLLRYTEPSKLAFVGSLHSMGSKSFHAEMEHLTCFLPGTLALGYIHGLGGEDHLKLAANLSHTCYVMYEQMPTKLSPEVAGMNLNPAGKDDLFVGYGTQYNLQRPETIESLFYMYRATKDKKYREWGWNIFLAFEKYTKVANGYASIDSVRRPDDPGYRDKMETFYLAETLKYLYLLFSDDDKLLPLDQWVINTEAHPLPVYPASDNKQQQLR